MLTKEDQKYIVNEYLSMIHDISDKEYQRRAWIRGELPGTDFDEAVCQYVDMGDPVLENYRDFGITDIQYHILRKFRDKFETFWNKWHWPPDFIDTPEWDEITKMAAEVLKVFDYKPQS